MEVTRNGIRFKVFVSYAGELYCAPPAIGSTPPQQVHLGYVDRRLPENKIKKIAIKRMRDQGVGNVVVES